MAVELEHMREAIGGTVYGSSGEKLGTVYGVFLDDDERPEWIGLKTGTWGLKHVLVPLDKAQIAGQRVDVPYDRRVVTETPKVKVDHGHIESEGESVLHDYYGLDDRQHRPHPLRAWEGTLEPRRPEPEAD